MKNKLKLTGAIIVVLLISIASLAGAVELQRAPLNPEFVKYQAEKAKGVVVSESGHPMGYVPSPLDLSHIKGSDITVMRSKALKTLPSAYDLRTMGYMTDVRDQDPYGTCWAFSALASLESTFKKSSGIAYDFSEWSLAYWARVDESASMPGFTQDSTPAGQDAVFDQGGNSWMSTAILGRWTGAVSETDRPYQSVTPWPESSRPLAGDPVAKHLEHTYLMGSDFDATVVKNAITEYGAVSILMPWSDTALNASQDSYYRLSTVTTGGNHLVAIAGWDDDYPASSFRVNPGSDGAWLVKNSWGTSWGDNGYFWLSYSEPTILYPSVFIGAAVDNFDSIYQYDPLGHSDERGFSNNTAWFSNVFTSKGIGGDSETLEAISFYADAANSSYEIEVWTGGTAGDPRSGTSAMTTQTGTLSIPGYHTVRLTSPVALPVGTRFSVVVKLTTPGYNYPIAMESTIAGYSEKATALVDQSYISSNGTSWSDLTSLKADANVCLKAFTTKGSTPTPPTPTPSSSGGGGCFVGYSPVVILLTLPLLLLKR